MEKHIDLTLPERREKSYVRSDCRTDTIFTFFRYKDVSMTFAKQDGTSTRLSDDFACRLLKDGLITQAQRETYESQICTEYFHKDCHSDQSPEDIYAFICRIRKKIFGVPVLEQARENGRRCGCVFDPCTGIDQRQKKQQLLQKSKAVIFVLCSPELFSVMETDVAAAYQAGKKIFICTSADGGGDLPDRQQLSTWMGQGKKLCYVEAGEKGLAWKEDLQAHIDGAEACLFFYGEEGLLHCRQLRIDAVVSAVPNGYHAQALCNQLGSRRACVVYIPAGRDMTRWVKLTEQTRLTYSHLSRLQKDHGDGIYKLTPQQLYSRYPGYFVNIYENKKLTFPIAAAGDTFAQFDQSKDAAIEAYLNSFDNISYTCKYFDEALKRQPICRDSTRKQPGILVHGVRVKKARDARIIACQRGVTPRETLAEQGLAGTGLISNFLFFLTPKLGVLYNDLRADRPLEQADATTGHLDYMLCHREGRRVETFPLFQKNGIAKTVNGEFFFFSFCLGGGSVRISDIFLRWEKADVNRSVPGAICIYTPFYSAKDENADRQTYRTFVGENRVNLVILQDKICCIRKGDVVLPSVGVVLSLTEDAAQPLLNRLRPLQDGYYDVSGMTLQVQLDGPEGVDPNRWQQVQWAYSGGMALCRNGRGLCDSEDMTRWFRQEGWLTPLSRQTQESPLHQLAKHPRTAIGTTQNGDLVILVYSGRTWRSTGADYREMIAIARELYPDIENLMNVDGGGSAVLGMATGGSFMELSYPATSTGSCAGMVRPINTLFYIPAEKGEQI